MYLERSIFEVYDTGSGFSPWELDYSKWFGVWFNLELVGSTLYGRMLIES
uniref:Uncharacterized protein n=1 Tax=Arundo donax TaxID=35708 RepID=A0A0A9BQU1_ARUDO